MKKVLVITYYWPPSGGGSVQRWLKFCKYLPDFGWEPTVYTPENPDFELVDKSLARDVRPGQQVVKLPMTEPRRIEQLLRPGVKGGATADEILRLDPDQRTRRQSAQVWAQSNFHIPDALSAWIKPSTEFLTECLTHEPVDAVVSTGPPHSMHLIAQGVKKNLDLPWIADFQDQWTNIVYYERLPLTRWADKKHKKLEQSVIAEADLLVKAAPSWETRLSLSGGACTETVTNGYDHEDVPEPRALGADRFRINYSGVLTSDHNHKAFWEALRAVSKGVLGFQNSVEIELVGKMDPSVIKVANYYGFSSNLVQTGYRPHSETLDRMASAHVLLLPINRAAHGAIPGKMFEYMALGRPILMIGPTEGDAARIIQETKTGVVASYDDFHGLKTVIADWYDHFRKRDLRIEPKGVEAYTRRRLTEKLAGLLDEITEDHPREQSLPRQSRGHTRKSRRPGSLPGGASEQRRLGAPEQAKRGGDPDQDTA